MMINCTINGRRYQFTVDPRWSLMELLRQQGLSSVKQGCSVGECGACTVLIDGIATDTCIYLAVWADGKTIRTAEGEVKNGELSAVQQAYVNTGAVQCGFCTPGLVMASTSMVERFRGKRLTEQEIRRGLAGNLCRCTGYTAIVKAVQQAQLLDEETPG
ncbi:xanthine dehydrogenase iron sulfur-binding subunit XdhC [Serratia oryzae]|uniref:xanthine dehydrogenase iron sulfur-binding subunit XdhC n=1 Tax=Serratia oryzae TaxID=2034155 RepID=UPI0012E25968